MRNQMKRKVFCIGLNKTGTTSLHEAFRILGLRSVHFIDHNGNNIKRVIRHNYVSGNDILEGIDEYDAYSDWSTDKYTVEIFKEFDKQYPGSKFILNTRDLSEWLDSKEKHVKRNREKLKHNKNKDIVWLEIDRDAWTSQFNVHYNAAREYFANRENDLLEINVTKGDTWPKLSSS